MNEAVRRWRMELDGSVALRPQDVDEIVSHLRESAHELHLGGLPWEQAFKVAAERLGRPRELEIEFGKLNARRVWMHRVCWMAAGFVLWGFIAWCSSTIQGVVMAPFARAPLEDAPAWTDARGHAIGFLMVAIRWMAMAGGVLAFWLAVTRWNDALTRFGRLCLRRPFLPAIGLVALYFGYEPLRLWLYATMTSAQPRAQGHADWPRIVSILNAWSSGSYYVGLVLWAAAFIFLARRSRGVKSAGAPSGWEVRRLWLGRGVWMVAGVVFYNFVLVNLMVTATAVSAGLAGVVEAWRPGSGPWLAVCLQFLLIGLALAAIANVVFRREVMFRRIARFGLARPVAGVLGLLLVFGVTELAAEHGMAGWLGVDPWFAGRIAITRGYLIFNAVIPALLLFWCGRQSMERSVPRASLR